MRRAGKGTEMSTPWETEMNDLAGGGIQFVRWEYVTIAGARGFVWAPSAACAKAVLPSLTGERVHAVRLAADQNPALRGLGCMDTDHSAK